MIIVDEGHGGMWQFSEAFREAFPTRLPRHYEDFLLLPGKVLKQEKHTIIRQVAGEYGAEDAASFVLKQYDYSMLGQLRSWHRLPKAQREYDALSFCRSHNIPAVSPVGFGAQRSSLGAVKSCFLITEFAQSYLSFRDWLRSNRERAAGDGRVEHLMRELGLHLRKAHAEQFFFFRLLAKNILVRPDEHRLDWLLLDQCYARRLNQAPLARSGQLRDVGALTGSVAKYCGTEVLEAFYSTYLPDPLGGSEPALRRRVERGLRIYGKTTPGKRLIHFARRRRHSASSSGDSQHT